MNIKSLVSKFGLSVNDVEECFYNALDGAKNIGGKNADDSLVHKFFVDLLEESGVSIGVSEKIADYYVYDLAKHIERKQESLAKKVLQSNKDPITVIRHELEVEDEPLEEDDSIQTSGEIDKTLGMSKNHPKVVPVSLTYQ